MKPILIVDDEAVMRESLRDWLVDEGYQVVIAEDGEQALNVIGEQDFGVVVLDLRLPRKNGLEVLKEARAKSPQLKGLIITAYPSVETAVEAIKLGAIDYLAKPFALDALERLIQEALGPVQVEIRPKVVTEEAVAEPAMVEEALVKGFWEGKIPCWEMCRCPMMISFECPAPKYQSMPCWEIEGTYCKLNEYGARGDDTTICQVCQVYKKWGGDKPIQIKLVGKGISTKLVS